jgi:UDP-2,4-diacetamido-2,4,6-trideoxy-beta-L-altropyranose hydrolase
MALVQLPSKEVGKTLRRTKSGSDSMNVVIRTDGSTRMGSGHVMRCLTLAEALVSRGVHVSFVSRELPGHMADYVSGLGHPIELLAAPKTEYRPKQGDVAHASWLGVSWRQDCEETRAFLGSKDVDWLIIDHYAIDRRWEDRLRPKVSRIMVIDDLADRNHRCDVLLDQTFGRQETSYLGRVDGSCELLLGSGYALLRPEFGVSRASALKKRKNFDGIKHILVSMGGTDPDNVSEVVLSGLEDVRWETLPQIQVVLGPQAPHLEALRRFAGSSPLAIEVLQGISDMAELMVRAEIAFGSCGTTSWERCCLGLPCLTTINAENQRNVFEELERCEALFSLGDHTKLTPALVAARVNEFLAVPTLYGHMTKASAEVCDGQGVERVMESLMCSM